MDRVLEKSGHAQINSMICMICQLTGQSREDDPLNVGLQQTGGGFSAQHERTRCHVVPCKLTLV